MYELLLRVRLDKQNTFIMRPVAMNNTISKILMVIFFSLIAFQIAFALSYNNVSEKGQVHENKNIMTSMVIFNQ